MILPRRLIRLIATLTAWSLVIPMTVHAANAPGGLIKLACPARSAADHPCRAVYFYGHDGKRHAFPNDKVYFTWYTDFSGVATVTPSFLASLPLGSNVTYRPGVKMVKFLTSNQVYAVALGGTLRPILSESVASDLYGTDWNKKIDDISDSFFSNYHFGPDVQAAWGFDRSQESAFAPTIDQDLDSTEQRLNVTTDRGVFDVDVITLHKDRFAMITDSAATATCTDNCPVKSLAEYAGDRDASIGIHGTYFCPPDYPECLGKMNSFQAPVFNSSARVMLNENSLAVHQGPMITSDVEGGYFFFHRTKDFGNSVAAFEAKHGTKLAAALANDPSLLELGTIVVDSETRLDDGQRTVKGVRGAIGMNGRFVYLVIAHQATVVDLASIMKSLGATDALNLDGGGSAALWYDGAYAVGPGRLLPNAILFRHE